jgi:hypothetical protein
MLENFFSRRTKTTSEFEQKSLVFAHQNCPYIQTSTHNCKINNAPKNSPTQREKGVSRATKIKAYTWKPQNQNRKSKLPFVFLQANSEPNLKTLLPFSQNHEFAITSQRLIREFDR